VKPLRKSGAWGIALAILIFGISGCSSAKKRSTTSELAALDGKKVALVSVDGEETPRKIVEVALVNQLVQRGTFILVAKEDLAVARVAPDQDPLDWRGIAKKAGADFALRAKVLKFEAPIHEGYSTAEVIDTQLAAERTARRSRFSKSGQWRATSRSNLNSLTSPVVRFVRELPKPKIRWKPVRREKRFTFHRRFDFWKLYPIKPFADFLIGIESERAWQCEKNDLA
jgi:hypothetical protein